MVINLVQNGSSITGTDSSHIIKIKGTIEDDVIKFDIEANWISEYRDTTGVWKVSADGTSLEGSWKVSGSRGGTGKWNLNRIE